VKHLFIFEKLSKLLIVEYEIFINSTGKQIEGRRIEILYGNPSLGLRY